MSWWTIPTAWASASASAICPPRWIVRRGFIGRPPITHRASRPGRTEGEKQLTLVFADFVEGGDVGVRERRGGTRFAEKAIAAIGIVGDVRGEHFDRDRAAEPRVAGAIDLAHPAGADPVENLVVRERLEHRTATIILTASRERLPHDPPPEPQLQTALHRPGDFTARRLVQLRRGLRAAPRSDGSATAVAGMLIVQFLPVASARWPAWWSIASTGGG